MGQIFSNMIFILFIELRERRLLTRGNKKRSIIAAVSNFDD